MMIRKLLVAGAALASMTAVSAGAVNFEPVNYTFNFTGKNTSTDPAFGNTLTQTVGGITVTASAWSIDKSIGQPFASAGTSTSLDLQSAKLVEYAGADYGLGVTDKYETGAAPYHTVDNVGAYDFIVLSFSQPVQLLFGTLNPFQVTGKPADNDAWVSFSDVSSGSTPITNPAVFANLMLHATEVLGDGKNAYTYLNPGMNTGTTWVVGADAFTGRAQDDGFKLASFDVQVPVPEPATWASMILGLGMVGAALRQRRGKGRRTAGTIGAA